MSKPSTPVRRSKVGPGRPGSAGGEIPLTASMEVLPPDPCSASPLVDSLVGRSQDFLVPVNGAKPRTPGNSSQLLSRTRSTDGRRSAMGPHEVIPLTSTTSKASASLAHAHPLPHPAPGAHSVASSAAGLPTPPPEAQQHPRSPAPGASAHGSRNGSAHASAGRHEEPLLPERPGTAMSEASSRFNPVTEGDDELHTQHHVQPRPPSGEAEARGPHVLLGGSAAAAAQRAASAASGGSGRRYAVTDSLQESQQGVPSREGRGTINSQQQASVSGRPWQLTAEQSDVPGTPASVKSGYGGGTFFTDLRRSFADGVPPGVDQSQDLGGGLGAEESAYDADGEQRVSRLGLASLASHFNPMQSPTSSVNGDEEDDAAFAEYAGEEGRTGGEGVGMAEVAAGLLAPGTAVASSTALTDFPNPMMTPSESRATTPPPAASSGSADAAASTDASQSLLLVIRDLYVTEEAPPPSPPAADQPSRPATAVSERPAEAQPAEPAPGGEEEGGDAEDAAGSAAADEAADLEASRAAVAALAARSEGEQEARRSELGEYMTALQDLKDDSGGRLVELPPDWGVMLERLFRQRRAEYATLEGWLGPRRFEDLPISQLPPDHPDPRVAEGLARVRELDGLLNDKLIAALISHRETFPEQWAEQERRRLERHSRAVEDALKRERHKRLRAARLARAVTSLDGPSASASASVAASSAGGPSISGGVSQRSMAPQPSVYSRVFTLKPEEEELVERVLRRNDEEGAALNPFDLDSAAAYRDGNGAAATSASGAAAKAASESGAAADPDDIELELDLLLPSAAASACPTPSAAAGARPRPFSGARASDADGAGSRPQSASSLSRPGTSSGAGGLSALAAAALHGHPALLAAGGLRASTTDSLGDGMAGPGGGGGGGLLPSRVYEDPRVAARALRAINARLAAFEREHVWDESGSLADFKAIAAEPSRGAQPQQQGQPQQPLASEASISSSVPAAADAGAAAGAGRPPSPGRSVRSGAGGPAASVSGASVTAGGQRDYLREERLAKELASRERDLDAALRRLKTGEVVRLGEATLKALVEQCRRLQDLNEQRRRVEEEEAAARKAQQQQQLQQQASASSSGGRAADSRASKGSRGASGGSSSRGQQAGRVSAPAAPADGSPAGGGSSGSGAAGGTPRHNSAGSTSGKSGSAAAGSPSSGRAGGSSSGARRASDPTTPAATTAPAPAAGASPHSRPAEPAAAGPSGAGSISSSKSSRSAAVAAKAGSDAAAMPTGTPPKPKPAARKGAGSAVSASQQSLQREPSAPKLAEGGLPPPPPPPPP